MRKLGMVLALAAVFSMGWMNSAKAELITNGGFETGDFTGWTQWGNTGFTGVSIANPLTGFFAADFGPVGSLGGILQDLATVVGRTYKLDFWLQKDGDTPNVFEVYWEGSTVLSEVDTLGQAYTHYTLYLTAADVDGFSELSFGFQHDPAFMNLDDISMVEVPVPAGAILFGIGAAGLAVMNLRRRYMTKSTQLA